MYVKTVQELIDLLQKIEDKSQEIYVWRTDDFYGSELSINKENDYAGKPLIIESNE